MVSQRGIEANPEKVRAIINMESPKTVKEVQKLTGTIAALNRFVSNTAVSGALIREEGKKQLPVYYVSQAFQGAESRYPKIEKIVFALIVASRKPRQYFQANPILVMTDQPIKKSMNEPEAVGRMVQWAIELSQFDIEYHPRTAIKGGVGVVIVTPEGEILKYGAQLKFPATNNEAEYEGILTGLRLEKVLGAKNLLVQNDSKLVIGQIQGEYEAKEERMQKYLKLMKRLTQEFDGVEFVQIPKSQNMEADEVSKIASSEDGSTNVDLRMEVRKYPSIEEVPTFSIQSIDSWMTPIISFLQDGHLPPNADEARKIKKRAARFTILNDTLYKRGFSMPYLKCVSEEEAKYILEEIHEGICEDRAGPRSLVSKVL
nr:uncharacterized protein LOC111996052 [Quercus suber]